MVCANTPSGRFAATSPIEGRVVCSLCSNCFSPRGLNIESQGGA